MIGLKEHCRNTNTGKNLRDKVGKSFLPILFFTATCFLAGEGMCLCGNTGNIAYAAALEKIDGINFWNGDRNYPLYNTGNKIGSALDLSSAYILSDDENELVIAVSDVAINYTENRIVAVSPLTFKENKKTGMAYCYHENSGKSRSVERNGPSDWLNDVYYYLKTALELN